tara:strand:+ start:383 stop:631 length:249 start_codon:yes stop_codon:yes gene_type:complete
MTEFDEYKAMEDSYQVLTGRKSFEDLLEEEDDVSLIFNPTRPVVVMVDDVYDVLIDHFASLEEYEKCQEILEIKNMVRQIQE